MSRRGWLSAALVSVTALGAIAVVVAADPTPASSQRSAEQARLTRHNQLLRHQLRAERRRHFRELHRAAQTRSTVDEAIHLAAVLFNIDEGRMRTVIHRESGFRPWAKNPSSTASGLGQFLDSTWAATPCGRAGMSVFSAYANALCMGWYVFQHGWGAWSLTAY